MTQDDAFPFQDRPYPERIALTALVLCAVFGMPWLVLISFARLFIGLFA